MKNHRQKQDYEAMQPSKKKMFLEKKQLRDIKEISRTIQKNGYC